MEYEELLLKADSVGLTVKEKPLRASKGRIKKTRIAIREDLTQAEKSCILAEELGHYYTTTGNILDQSDTWNRKQEHRARMYGYNLRIGLMGLVGAYESGCRNRYEIAEHLGVTEEYLEECIHCYREKYGTYATIDNYIIYFIPSLMVGRMTDDGDVICLGKVIGKVEEG
ncbi:MAG: ImmA/IrrE family metallo-endopeptidase [Lachnospiraceae bacterium]|jgi:hypothetical protein|nr:ImmA/IrrE family metallo-endopeptidase [Lachnospiraceae bacterium]